jgi:hypothetical protein
MMLKKAMVRPSARPEMPKKAITINHLIIFNMPFATKNTVIWSFIVACPAEVVPEGSDASGVLDDFSK